MWVTCVLGSALFFIIQVALRVTVYFEYNTNVDVEKVYTTKVLFPAVTICNQNNFRWAQKPFKRLLANMIYVAKLERKL